MRGTDYVSVDIGGCTGITPAYAGNSYKVARRCHIKRDHPRVCGEQVEEISIYPQGLGSPPRMRGTDIRAKKGIARVDHPRVCGEQRPLSGGGFDALGSPPRMRGTALFHVYLHARRRITPAYAGNRIELVKLMQAGRDHPRVCGEQSAAEAIETIEGGSPPRMRGTV